MLIFLFISLLVIPFFFTPFKIGSPFFILFFFIGFLFIAKFQIFKHLKIGFIFNLSSTEIESKLLVLFFYILVAYATSLIYILFKSKKTKKFNYKIKKITYWSAIIFPSLIMIIVVSMGINPITQTYLVRKFTQSQGMFYFLVIIIFLINLIVFLFCRQLFLKKIPKLVSLVATSICLFYALFSGLSSTIVVCFALCFIFLSTYKRSKIEIYLLFIFPLVMLYATIHGQYRLINVEGAEIKYTELFQKIDFKDEETIGLIFNRFDYLEMFVRGNQYISNIEPDFGKSLMSGFIQFIPRALWPEKPYNTSTYFSKIIIPEVVDEVGSTANFNSLNEFSRAFGTIGGVFIGGIFLGIILGWCYTFFRDSFNNPYKSLQYTFSIYLFFYVGFIAGYINEQGFQLLIINSLLFKLFVKKISTVNT